MITALHHHKIKPQNLHDWGSESTIDPINPLVYIQARNLDFCYFYDDLYIVFRPLKLKCMMSALKYHIFKPQNLHDWGSESAIDPINPLVYIQARHREFKTGLIRNKIIQDIVRERWSGFPNYVPSGMQLC